MRAVSLLLLLAAVLPEVARAQCYLENANAGCSVCWRTVYASATDKTGVTTMAECPMTITVNWDTKPPVEMYQGTSYPVQYALKIAPESHKVTLAAKKTTTISHANIHSCIASRGACTPFVANSPGLATHTAELTGNFDANGLATFTSDMLLTPEVYTIIAHVRFYEPNSNDPSMPPTKIDACAGISRTVAPEISDVSQDSYVMTGVVGAVLLIMIGAVTYASRKGILDFEKILEIIYSETVTCMIEIIVGLGDVTAFTISVVSLVAVDNALIQVLPACYLFLTFAWGGSLYNAYHDSIQLYTVYFQHFKHTTFVDGMSYRISSSMVRKAKKAKKESLAGKPYDAPDIRNHLAQHVRLLTNERANYDVLLELEHASRELRRKRGDIITILTESLPITAIQCYILALSGTTQIITILVMFFSSTVFGAKLASLGTYKETRQRKMAAEENFKKAFHIFPLNPGDDDAKGGGKVVDSNNDESPSTDGTDGAKMARGKFLVRQYTEGGLLPASGALVVAVNIVEGPEEKDPEEFIDDIVRDYQTFDLTKLEAMELPNTVSTLEGAASRLGTMDRIKPKTGDDNV
mmetsp:Transcript_55624/g.132077  ORF Transcript_55624/g.132077 Transcript_55624/m.132077 type:complete len:580 (+) Transcript_55624:141-1880(+)